MRDPAHLAAERAARLSYGRLLAYLAREWRDVAAAEDALADAFARALAVWPETGIPTNPDGWLLVAARRRLLDRARSGRTAEKALPDLVTLAATEADVMTIPDQRLALMFVCAHPAIDEAIRTPLMLQTVLGLDAARIASAFLVAPATMGQRLVRAKARIAEIGIRFEILDADDLPERAGSVIEAIYAAYGAGWDGGPAIRDLADEAIWLAEVLVDLLPDEPEARGLFALMHYSEARRAARRDADGRFVPLKSQNWRLWDAARIRTAEAALERASRSDRPGRFQIEAAIQSALTQSIRTGTDLSVPILGLHEALLRFAPTIGNSLGYAAALAEVKGAAAGLEWIEDLSEEKIRNHQPYWAVRGYLLKQLGRMEEARAALERAAGLSDDPAVRRFLLEG